MDYSFEYLVELYKKFQQGGIDPTSDVGQLFASMEDADLQDFALAVQKQDQPMDPMQDISDDTISDDAMSNAMFMDRSSIKKTLDTKKSIMSKNDAHNFQIQQLIQAYRKYGVYQSELDPLGLKKTKPMQVLDIATYGLHADDKVDMQGLLGFQETTVKNVVHRLRLLYCGTVGFEFEHMDNPKAIAWMVNYIENGHFHKPLDAKEKKSILEDLAMITADEHFLDLKHQAVKRFGADGIETIIPVLKDLVKLVIQQKETHMILGMAHRGRLSVLSHVVQKPLDIILNEFEKDTVNPMGGENGDVKYHLGWRSIINQNNQELFVELLPNPSHLESVDPVLMGYVRSIADHDHKKSRPIGVMIHGDGAVIGEGVVAECLNLSMLAGYGNGLGFMHIVLDNQIAYTSESSVSRSTPFSTGIFKGFNIPIVHVNAADPEMAIAAIRLLYNFKLQFHTDVALDIIGFRLHGHNEGDEPTFTNPVLYQGVAKTSSIFDHYAQKLQQEGVIVDHGESFMDQAMQIQDQAFKADKKTIKEHGKSLAPAPFTKDYPSIDATGVSDDLLQTYGTLLYTLPENFHLNPKLKRILKAREHMVDTHQGIDWGMAENLAYASLLGEGFGLRLSGEDVTRGTFSHRHAIMYDYENGQPYEPLRSLVKEEHVLEICSSPVSEFGVMGFDYGYSLVSPNTLTIWEGQFGDFANPAQVIIDQYISSGDSKWNVKSGLILLLPHGQEGMGPEHSSGRVERYLQMCAQDNFVVGYVSTTANFFHYFRRHMLRGNQQPLILMTPKSLLRLPQSFATFKDLSQQSSFHEVYDEVTSITKPKKIVLCAGKIYYDLFMARTSEPVALIRIEQLYPWPEKVLASILKKYGKNVDYVWAQEEPENNGAWAFVRPRLETLFQKIFRERKELTYIGRPPMASPAVGIPKLFTQQQQTIVQQVLKID